MVYKKLILPKVQVANLFTIVALCFATHKFVAF